MKLHLHVKSEYFAQIKAGTKTEEYREITDYWDKRLTCDDAQERSYDGIVIYNAYKPGAENRIEFPWSGWRLTWITHPHFGPGTVGVYAIKLEARK